MREIKFRAWVQSDKCMIEHREVIERAHLQFNGSLNASDIVMQFTGLKDRNGKEIYEGDIVVMNAYMEDYYEDTIDINFIGEVVIISSKGVCLKNPKFIDNISGNKGKHIGYYNVRGYRSEIIGNIYKNTKLSNKQ